MSQYHIPVLLQSACDLLDIQPGKRYIDATCGGGGHTQEIIKRGGKVLSIDQDPDAIRECSQIPKTKTVLGNFVHIDQIAHQNDWFPVAGIIYDLGTSRHQIMDSKRGFSYRISEPLDMRMDPELLVSAATLVNTLSVKQLETILHDYGELSNFRRVAKEIYSHRPFITTEDLYRLFTDFDVKQKVFQALRIAVNDELESLNQTLPKALSLLAPQGRLVVISFHSLEDRIVKNTFLNWATGGKISILTKRPVIPDDSEIKSNPLSKSAKLRAIIKI